MERSSIIVITALGDIQLSMSRAPGSMLPYSCMIPPCQLSSVGASLTLHDIKLEFPELSELSARWLKLSARWLSVRGLSNCNTTINLEDNTQW
jgi:hypothetical protein